jgi:hypothetical protein
MNFRALTLTASVAALALHCEPRKPDALVANAKFGVFFGGQIQERREIPFDLDPTKLTQGFRIEFRKPLVRDATVEWRIDKPVEGARKRRLKHGAEAKSPEPATASERAVAHAGETRFERVTHFEPGDPLGLWNVRVLVDDKVVIDRPFEVYDPATRSRSFGADGGL